jgi:hypothetical protein
MAAVLAPAPHLEPAPRPGAARPGTTGRPQLRLIPGGRSPQALAATYRRRRVVAALVVVTVPVVAIQLAQALAGVIAGWSAPASAPIDGPTVVVEAEAGDTLWTLARRVHPSGDVRPVVEAMVADRGTAAVDVGDDVRVPQER